VTGLSLRSELLDDDVRLRAALAYDAFAIDVPGLLDRAAESQVISRWQFPTASAPVADSDVPF
jgi:hypothetical protein